MLRDSLASLDGWATWPCDEINAVWRRGIASNETDELLPSMISRATRRTVDGAFTWVRRKYRVDGVVEKTCANSLRVEFVDNLLPDALFIFLYRDPLDAVASAARAWHTSKPLGYSLAKLRFVPGPDKPRLVWKHALRRLNSARHAEGSHPWGPDFIGMRQMLDEGAPVTTLCSMQWSRCIENSVRGLRSLPSERVLSVSYEALCGRPGSTLGEIQEWLGGKASKENIKRAASEIHSASIGAHSRDLDDQTKKAIMDIAEGASTTIDQFAGRG